MSESKKNNTVMRAMARTWKAWAGIGGLIIIVLWTAGACTRKIEPAVLDTAAGIPLPAGAATITVKTERAPTRIDIVGTASSAETVHLSARLPAYVSEVFVSAGDTVTQGQALVTLDDRELRQQLSAAEAQHKQAEQEFTRATNLLKTGATTAQARDAAESAFNSAKANLDRLGVMLSYTRITSPINGLVTDRRVEAGDLANPGQVLISVYDPANMRIEAPVPMRLIKHMGKGQKVDVVLEETEGTLKGTVEEIVGEIDPASRTQRIRVGLENADVLPGTFGRIWLAGAEHDALLVPASALYSAGQLEFVQVVQGDRVIRRLVKSGMRHADRVEIISGLKPGDTILAKPIQEG